MFGAPFGGTTRMGQYGVDCAALRSIFPLNSCGSGGSWLPSIVVVALGEPGAPVTCCANVGSVASRTPRATTETLVIHWFADIGGASSGMRSQPQLSAE